MRRLLLVAALLLPLTACGDDDADTARATTTTPEDDAGDGAEDGGASVTISGFEFQPSSIEVTAGSSITWTNEDGVTHTVTAGTPGSPEDTFSETLDGGTEATISFDEPGEFPYFCSIHPRMTAEVVVSS